MPADAPVVPPVTPPVATAPPPAATPPVTPPVAATPPVTPPAKVEPPVAAPNVIADAKTVATPLSLDDVKKELIEKGAKAEDLAALDEAALRAKHEEAVKAKPADAKPDAAKAEEFSITAPEGVELDPEQVKAFQEALADANLSPKDRAQKLFDLHQKALTDSVEAPAKLWMDTQKTWAETWKKDSEIGGANFDAVTSTIAKAIDEVGGADAKAIREAFIFTGAGNNPVIGKLVYRMAKALVEGGAISGDTPAKLGEGSADKALGALYPTATKVR